MTFFVFAKGRIAVMTQREATLPKIIFPRLPRNATSYGSFEVKLAKLSEVPLALQVKGC